MGVGDFALMLRLAVKICGIRRVALCVISLRAGEDAVGAEVNQPRTGFAAALGQAVWKLGVDAQGERLVTGFVALLDEADAVDDGLGLRLAKGALKCGVVGDVIELDRLGFVEQIMHCEVGDRTAKRHPSVVLRVEPAPKLVAQHAAAAEYEQPQG